MANRRAPNPGASAPSIQVRHFSDGQWEEFIEDACHEMKDGSAGRYCYIKRLGGAGDGGRDIEARLVPALEAGNWDLFQAKHYAHPLAPSEFFPELAKFFTNLSAGVYPAPRFYFICAPQNTGPDLHNLLAKPVTFKKEFVDAWKTGKRGLKGQESGLTKDVVAALDAFDFSNIQEVLVRTLLETLARNDAKYCKLFHIEMERGEDPDAPPTPTAEEQPYISELLKAYSEEHGKFLDVSTLAGTAYETHFTDCRSDFYCAEGLKRFSRDLFAEDEFGKFLGLVHSGIRTAVSDPLKKSGLERLSAALERAAGLSVAESQLSKKVRPGDLPGACHHLVNDKRLTWVP